jgi:hypothetical protein
VDADWATARTPSCRGEQSVWAALQRYVPNLYRSHAQCLPLEPPLLTWLILKDGTGYLVRDYWFQFGKLQCITLDGERKWLPLARLDLDETIRLNQERNVHFVIRGQER